MRKQTVAFSKETSNLFFHILTKCNLRCAHCYINPKEHGDTTLDIDTIQEWLKIFSEKAGSTNLVLLGGEPTLHPDLDQAVKTANALNFKSITIDTNGFLFHNILDKITPDEVDFISFSLDGATKACNDKIRGDGCWDAVMSGLKRARARGFSCSMIYTVSEHNIHELPLMPEVVRDLGISRFFIQVIGMRGEAQVCKPALGDQKSGDTLEIPKLQVSKDVWLTQVPKVAKEIAKQGIIVTYPKVFLDLDEPFECAGLVADNYFVFPNKRVYQCPICEDFPLHAYEIKNNSLTPRPKLNETDLFQLKIGEGCVMNKMVQPDNLAYDCAGNPCHKIACCMLKQELIP